MQRKSILITSLLTLLLVFGCSKPSNGLKKNDIKPLVYRTLNEHVTYKRLNDNYSQKIFKDYIYSLDPGKIYFKQADIDSLQKYKNSFDDCIRKSTYEEVFAIYDLYNQRFKEGMKIANELLKEDYDFSKEEFIVIDSKKLKYATSDEELKERWRKNVKLQIMNYVSTDLSQKEAKEKLKHRYQIINKKIKKYNESDILDIFAKSALSALDPHTNYLTAEEHEDFQMESQLKFEGIGARLRSEDGFVYVESIIPGGPADKLAENTRLHTDDKIVAVAQANEAPEHVIDMDLRDVVKLIRGTKGTTVKLHVIRSTEDNKSTTRLVIPIERDKITLEDQAAKSEIIKQKMGNKTVNVGYLKLPGFYYDYEDPKGKRCSKDVYTEVQKLKKAGMQSLVLDLRGNGGGYLEEALTIVGFFIDKGPILQIKYFNNQVDVRNDLDAGVIWDGPLVVLIDKFSASASEIFAGTIKDYQRGLIVGASPTFGKGSVQTYKPLSRTKNKGAYKVTLALFYQPSGVSNQLTGIKPDVQIPSITTIFDIGEDKLRNPLKWDPIPSAKFSPYTNYLNPNLVNQLQMHSKQRVAKDQNFQKLEKRITKLSAKLNKKEISLKLEKADKSSEKEIKNISKEMVTHDQKKLYDLKHDLLLKEALKVTGEYTLKIK